MSPESEEFVTKRKRFSVERIVAVLEQAEQGMNVADRVRNVGISEQTFYRWKKQYSELQSNQVRELSIEANRTGLEAEKPETGPRPQR